MKINSVALSAVPSYKTAFVSIAHLSPADFRNLEILCHDDYFFCHNVCNDGSAFIVRFGQIVPEQHEMLDFLVSQYDFTPEFAEFMRLLGDAGFDAVHFDPEFDLVQGQTWYTDLGTKVVPLAYDVDVQSFDQLTDEQRGYVLTHLDETEAAAENNYLVVEGVIYSMADCMRLDSDSEMSEYGFSGTWGESNTSALFCMLSDDSETADIVRVF